LRASRGTGGGSVLNEEYVVTEKIRGKEGCYYSITSTKRSRKKIILSVSIRQKKGGGQQRIWKSGLIPGSGWKLGKKNTCKYVKRSTERGKEVKKQANEGITLIWNIWGEPFGRYRPKKNPKFLSKSLNIKSTSEERRSCHNNTLVGYLSH